MTLWRRINATLQKQPTISGFPGYNCGKEPTCPSMRHKSLRLDPWVAKMPRRRAWQPSPLFMPGESHGQRILGGYSPQGHTESDTTKATQHAKGMLSNLLCFSVLLWDQGDPPLAQKTMPVFRKRSFEECYVQAHKAISQ